MSISDIYIYSDGSCRVNPGGVGGWGVVITDVDENILYTLSGGVPNTTNSRMELTAVIEGLELVYLQSLSNNVTLLLDSTYVIDKGQKDRPPIQNRDLWQRYLTLKQKIGILKFIWIPGHKGHPLQEIADTLATNASGDLKEWLVKKRRNRKRSFNFTHGKTSLTKQVSTPKTLMEVFRDEEPNESLDAPFTTIDRHLSL